MWTAKTARRVTAGGFVCFQYRSDKTNSGASLDAQNFRSDVNANGSINASDVSLVKANSGTSVNNSSLTSAR